MREAAEIAEDQPDRPTGGKHRRTTGPVRVRRRWLVVAAVAAAFTGLVAPPPGPGVQVADAASGDKLTPGAAIDRLSFGAPTGSIVLASAPAHVAAPQPMAPTVITGLAANGIPNVALNAYRVAAARMGTAEPSCGIDWSLLAGIGRVESNHGRFGGAVLNSDGTSTPRIIGPSLDGVQFAFIRDTDHGALGRRHGAGPRCRADAVHPGHLARLRRRRRRDGSPDPFNINDAALAAAHYLCVAGGDLRTAAGQRRR